MLLGILTCREALQRLDDYVDRELADPEMAQICAHLRICHACARRFRSEAGLMTALRSKVDHLDVPADLMASISRSLAQELGESPDRPVRTVVF